jgi:hypothetical protein
MARIIGILIVLALAGGTAYALGVGGEGRQFGRMGATAGKSSAAPPPGTNFRITNTGDFRVTSTGDSRVISP